MSLKRAHAARHGNPFNRTSMESKPITSPVRSDEVTQA